MRRFRDREDLPLQCSIRRLLVGAVFAGLSVATLHGQEIGYYCATIADFGLRGHVSQMQQEPRESYDETAMQFHPGGEAAELETFQFDKNGIMSARLVDTFLPGGGSKTILAFAYKYDGNRVLKSITQNDEKGQVAVLSYSTSRTDDWTLLSPQSAYRGDPADSLLRPYAYRLRLRPDRTVIVLRPESTIEYEVHFNAQWIKTSVAERFPSAGKQVAYINNIAYTGDGQILREFSSGVLRSEYTYDGHGLCIEWDTYSTALSREVAGVSRYAYGYSIDARGNWIERIIYVLGESGKKTLARDKRRLQYYD
jgi:hypothetical protein